MQTGKDEMEYYGYELQWVTPCKNCIYWRRVYQSPGMDPKGLCMVHDGNDPMDPDDFCSWGESKREPI